MKRNVLLKLMAASSLAVVFSLTGCAPVTVSSVPPDAQVYHKNGNRQIGVTPVKVNIYASSRKVIVRKNGYFSKTVVLSTLDPENVEVALKRRSTVFLTSKPTGAGLYVRGKKEKVGSTPFKIDFRKSYRKLEVRSFGYVSQVIDISDPEGNIEIELVREPAVMLSSNPKHSSVFNKSGRKIGTTPMNIPVAKKKAVELRKVGYFSKKVTVGPKSKSPVIVELARDPVVIVQSDPEGAIVMHRGVALGKTPYRLLLKKEMELELSLKRFYTSKIALSLDSDRLIKIKLKSKPYITVKSSPANAKLYRPGGVELVGATPVEILVESDTSFEMRKSGYIAKPFMLSSNSKREVIVPLVAESAAEKLGKTVLIDSKPSGAKVYRPGGAELIGTTPFKQTVIFERTLELQLNGYNTKIVTIAPDSSDKVVFVLVKEKSLEDIVISDPLLNTPASF